MNSYQIVLANWNSEHWTGCKNNRKATFISEIAQCDRIVAITTVQYNICGFPTDAGGLCKALAVLK